MAYTSEAGHWYDREGVPCYTLKNLNGNIKNTNLSDARKLKLVPSVTEILKLYASPGLEWWKREQVKLSALTLPQKTNESLDQFSKRIDFDANQQAIEARDLGTDIHGQIERYFQGLKITCHEKIVYSLAVKLKEEFGEQEWYAENSFTSPLGFGGKIDLFSKDWVIDYKTKDFTVKDMKNKFSYDTHLLQLNAYRLGLALPNAGIANVFISRNTPGLIKIEKHERLTGRFRKNHEKAFIKLLEFWQEIQGFDTGFQ